MAGEHPTESTEGWLFRATNRGAPAPRYFVVGSTAYEKARQLVEAHPDVGGDQIEMVGPVTVPNMMRFEVGAGEVKQIDAPYP
jgi:hypothetical protein